MKLRYRIEVFRQNPDDFVIPDVNNIVDIQRSDDREQAKILIRNYHKQGYWIETYEDRTGQLIDGPIDPDGALPSSLLMI